MIQIVRAIVILLRNCVKPYVSALYPEAVYGKGARKKKRGVISRTAYLMWIELESRVRFHCESGAV